jgi:hypothetical protein
LILLRRKDDLNLRLNWRLKLRLNRLDRVWVAIGVGVGVINLIVLGYRFAMYRNLILVW